MLSTTPTMKWRRAVCEATRLFEHIGFYEEYFEDVWRAAHRFEDGEQADPAPYDLALYSFSHAAGKSTRRLKHSRPTLAAFFHRFGELWGPAEETGSCPVLDVWADRDRIYPLICEKTADILREWQAVLASRLTAELVEARQAKVLAAEAVIELAGGYRLGKAYRNRAHFERALHRVQARLLLASKKREN